MFQKKQKEEKKKPNFFKYVSSVKYISKWTDLGAEV